MRRTREHPFALTAVAFVVAAGAVVAIAAAYGFGAFADAWSDLPWPWLLLTLLAALLVVPAYAVCYRAVAAVNGGPRLRVMVAVRAVAHGFAPFAAGGGF